MIGLAIVHSNVLIDVKVKLFKEKWTNSKQKRMVDCICTCLEEYQVAKVALVIPYKHYSNLETETLLRHIKACCTERNIPFVSYSPDAFHCFCRDSHPSKRQMMQTLADGYPELAVLQKKEARNRSKYYYKVFEAAAAAILFSRGIMFE